MAQFQVGDVVRRIKEANEDCSGNRIEVGDVLTVARLSGAGWLVFDRPFIGHSDPKYFELVSKRGFKVGNKVRRKPEFRTINWYLGAQVVTVTEVSTFAGKAWIYCDLQKGGGFADRFDLVEAAPTAPVVEHTSRANDPATSVAAGKVKRTSLRERVWIVMCGGYYEPRPEGWTGHELAAHMDAPLNSVTPRLAELRRADKIKDSGQRRDKQIVWVLA